MEQSGRALFLFFHCYFNFPFAESSEFSPGIANLLLLMMSLFSPNTQKSSVKLQGFVDAGRCHQIPAKKKTTKKNWRQKTEDFLRLVGTSDLREFSPSVRKGDNKVIRGAQQTHTEQAERTSLLPKARLSFPKNPNQQQNSPFEPPLYF